jgi:hypothetical protein
MYSGKRTGAVFVKDHTTQEMYADYFLNMSVKEKKKPSGGTLRYLLNYFCCFST